MDFFLEGLLEIYDRKYIRKKMNILYIDSQEKSFVEVDIKPEKKPFHIKKRRFLSPYVFYHRSSASKSGEDITCGP